MTNAATTWDELKDLLRWFAAIFGQPKDLYEDQVVRKKHGLLIRGWIAGLEAIARALLMAMAAALPKPEATPRPPKRRAKTKRAARAPHPAASDIAVGVIEAPDSELWADVSFVLVPKKRSGRVKRSARGKPSGLMKTRPLAYRLEALIRVAERPEHYARRLAVRLYAEPNLAFRLLRQPAPIGCESFPREEVGRAQAHGWMAYDAFTANTG
jgi:hypothetical protein